MKQTKKLLFASVLLSFIWGQGNANAVPVGDASQQASVTKKELRRLICDVQDDIQFKKNGLRMSGTEEEYHAHPGLIIQDNQGNAGFANAQNKTGRVFWPRWMFNSGVGRAQDDFITEFTPPRGNKGPRHWIQFDLKKKYKNIVLKYTGSNRYKDNVNGGYDIRKHGCPTKVALVAPKSGEKTGVNDVWTDTLWQDKTIPTYRSEYVYHDIKWDIDSSTYVGECNFPHETQLVRFVVLETDNDPSSSNRGWGPNWGLSEMRLFDGAEWQKEYDVYKHFDQKEKDAIVASLQDATKALDGDAAAVAAAYESLDKAFQHFKVAFNPIELLTALVDSVEKDLVSKRTVGEFDFKGTAGDYKKYLGIVRSGNGNADIDGSHTQNSAKLLFDNSIWNPGLYYHTEWSKDRLDKWHPGMSKQRHWVQFDLGKELADFVLKFSYASGTAYPSTGLTEVAFVAPAKGEDTHYLKPWTDTLCKVQTIPTYTTVNQWDSQTHIMTRNTTFVGKVQLSHPTRLIRLVVLKDRDGNTKSEQVLGPQWGASEMRFYESAGWEEKPAYKMLPEQTKSDLLDVLETARFAAYENKDLIKICDSYNTLSEKYEAFVAQYSAAELQIQQNEKMSVLLTEVKTFVADSKFNAGEPFYMYMSGSKGAGIQALIEKATKEVEANAALSATYTDLENAFADLKAQLTPEVAKAYWNNYRFDDYSTAKKTAEIMACIETLNGMTSYDVAAWTSNVAKFNESFIIEYLAPTDGSFFRMKTSAKNGKPNLYLTSDVAINGGNRFRTQFKTVTDVENNAEVIFYMQNNGQLLGYGNGNLLRVNGGNTFRTVPVDEVEYNGVNREKMIPLVFTYSKASAAEYGAYSLKYKGYDNTDYYATVGDAYGSINVPKNVTDANTVNANFFLEKVNALPVSISAAKYASFYTPVALTIPQGVKAYVGKRVDNTAFQLQEITTGAIPANTAVILTSEEGIYSFAISKENVEAIAGNELQGQLMSDYETAEVYTLQQQENVVGLYPFTGRKNYDDKEESHKLLQGFKAYLPETVAVNVLKFVFDGESTGIENVSDANSKPKVYYNLDGVRVFYPTHGVYITSDGKKVYIP